MAQPAHNNSYTYPPGYPVPPPPEPPVATILGAEATQTDDPPQHVPGRIGRWFWLIKGAEAVLHIAVLAVKLYNELMSAINM